MIDPHGQPLSLGPLGRRLPGEQPGLGAKDIKAQGMTSLTCCEEGRG